MHVPYRFDFRVYKLQDMNRLVQKRFFSNLSTWSTAEVVNSHNSNNQSFIPRKFCVSTDTIQNYKIVSTVGLVSGSTVQTRNVFRMLFNDIRQIFGGELRNYTLLLSEARAEATNRMLQEATNCGADAVINVRFGTSNFAHDSCELLAYGTAVRIEPQKP